MTLAAQFALNNDSFTFIYQYICGGVRVLWEAGVLKGQGGGKVLTKICSSALSCYADIK